MKIATDEGNTLFYLYDGDENLVWRVSQGDGTSGKMYIADEKGEELLHVTPAIVSLHPKYHLSIAGIERVRVGYKSGLGCNPTLTGAGGWSLLGNACAGEYSVVDRDKQVIFSHERKWGTGGEYVQLEVPQSQQLLLSAGIAATIDQTILITPQAQPV